MQRWVFSPAPQLVLRPAPPWTHFTRSSCEVLVLSSPMSFVVVAAAVLVVCPQLTSCVSGSRFGPGQCSAGSGSSGSTRLGSARLGLANTYGLWKTRLTASAVGNGVPFLCLVLATVGFGCVLNGRARATVQNGELYIALSAAVSVLASG